MDALGDVLGPYSDFIAKIAGTITTLQFLSGVFLLNDIRKQQSSDKYPVEPFLGGIVLSVLGSKLGEAMNDEATVKVNVIGIVINIIFLGVFYYYSSNVSRPTIWSKSGKATLIVLAGLAYANFEDPAKLETRLGLIITAILVALVGTPLLHINKIFEKKSTEGMPFPIIFSGTMVALSWMVYGISIKNTVVIYQNMLIFVLSSIQLSMFAIFPSTPTTQLPKKKKNKKDN